MKRAGCNYYLNVLTPIIGGQQAALRTTIETFGNDARSPFARLETTHFARLVILEALGADRAGEHRQPLDPALLYFAANFSDDPDRFISAMVRESPETVDTIWRSCAGYPGLDDDGAFGAYLRAHQVDNNMCLGTSVDANLADVRTGLATRARLIDLVTTTQGLPPAELKRTVLATLGAT